VGGSLPSCAYTRLLLVLSQTACVDSLNTESPRAVPLIQSHPRRVFRATSRLSSWCPCRRAEDGGGSTRLPQAWLDQLKRDRIEAILSYMPRRHLFWATHAEGVCEWLTAIPWVFARKFVGIDTVWPAEFDQVIVLCSAIGKTDNPWHFALRWAVDWTEKGYALTGEKGVARLAHTVPIPKTSPEEWYAERVHRCL
jgi:hypothetical protein